MKKFHLISGTSKEKKTGVTKNDRCNSKLTYNNRRADENKKEQVKILKDQFPAVMDFHTQSTDIVLCYFYDLVIVL